MNHEIERWSREEVCNWVRSIGREQEWNRYAAALHNTNTDGRSLLFPVGPDLINFFERLGFSVDHAAIAAIRLDEMLMRCTAHHRPWERYCMQHQAVVCVDCALDKCSLDHPTKLVKFLDIHPDTHLEPVKSNLGTANKIMESAQQASVLLKEAAETTTRTSKETESRIKEYFETCRRRLAQQEAEMLATLKDHTTRCQEAIKSDQEGVTTVLSKLAASSSQLESHLKNSRTQMVSVVKVRKQLEQELTEAGQVMQRERAAAMKVDASFPSFTEALPMPKMNIFPFQPDPEKCEFIGRLEWWTPRIQELSIVARNSQNARLTQGGAAFQARVTYLDESQCAAEASIRDNSNGTYTLTFQLPAAPRLPTVHVYIELGGIVVRKFVVDKKEFIQGRVLPLNYWPETEKLSYKLKLSVPYNDGLGNTEEALQSRDMDAGAATAGLRNSYLIADLGTVQEVRGVLLRALGHPRWQPGNSYLNGRKLEVGETMDRWTQIAVLQEFPNPREYGELKMYLVGERIRYVRISADTYVAVGKLFII